MRQMGLRCLQGRGGSHQKGVVELDGDDNGVKDGNIDDIDMVNVDIDVFFNIGSDDCQYEGIKAILTEI